MPLVKPSAGPEPSTGTDLEILNNFVAESMDFASGSDDPSGLELDPLLIGDNREIPFESAMQHNYKQLIEYYHHHFVV